MNNPRARSPGTLGRYASAATRAEPLVRPTVGDPAVQRWINAVTQRLEVAEGARSQWDEVITRRDLGNELVRVGVVTQASGRPPGGGGVATVAPDGTVAYVSIESFSESIRTTKLFTDLTRRIDETRFDDLPARTRALLLEDIAQVRQEADASIRRVDDIIKTATESFAQTVTTVQANISSAAAGVRQVHFASASLNRATAGLVTTITARLDNFSGGAPGTATVESKMTAIADRATGLEAQYTVKVTAGGYTAGFGLATTLNNATPTSAFIIQADKFAVVPSSYSGGLTNTPPSGNLPFVIDAGTGNVAISGSLLVAGSVTASALNVSTLSAITANLGSVTAGNITGTANIDITGSAKVKGSFTSGSYNVALAVNESYSAQTGIVAYTTGSTFSAIVGAGMATGASGVFGSSSGGTGVGGNATGSGGVGVSAVGVLGATALSVTGLMTINNSTLVTNLNANFVGGKQASELCQIVVGNTGTATVAGAGGLNLTTTVSGVTVTCSSNNIVIEPVSDARLKRDIEDEALGLNFIRQLKPRTYRMKADPSLLYHGFLYQEIAEVLPREGDALVQHRPDRYGGVDYNSLIAPLVLAAQQQDSEVQALRARVAALESQLAA